MMHYKGKSNRPNANRFKILGKMKISSVLAGPALLILYEKMVLSYVVIRAGSLFSMLTFNTI